MLFPPMPTNNPHQHPNYIIMTRLYMNKYVYTYSYVSSLLGRVVMKRNQDLEEIIFGHKKLCSMGFNYHRL